MLNKNLDGITKKSSVTTTTGQTRLSQSKKLDGLIGVKKSHVKPAIAQMTKSIGEPMASKEEAVNIRALGFKEIFTQFTSLTSTSKKKICKHVGIYRKKYKKIIRKKSADLKIAVKKAFKKSFVFLLWLLGAVFLAYVVYSSFILFLKPKNSIVASINNIIPIPAVITDQGVISYNRFQKIAMGSTGKDALDKNISALVRDEFLELYGIKKNNPTIDGLNNLVYKDEGINGTAMARINKIKNEMVKFGFEEVYKKYGDEYNDGEYVSRENAQLRFNNSLIDYGGDKLSPILYGDTGYYIVNVVDNKSDPIGIKYVYVKAKNFDEYLNDEIKKIRYWKLIR